MSTLRARREAYSERYIAAPSPSGTATSSAMTVVTAVPPISGSTAYCPSVAKKSPNGTSAKKSMTGRIRATMMPTVMATDRRAEPIRMPRITVSAGRARRLRLGAPGRPAPWDGPAPVLEMLLMSW